MKLSGNPEHIFHPANWDTVRLEKINDDLWIYTKENRSLRLWLSGFLAFLIFVGLNIEPNPGRVAETLLVGGLLFLSLTLMMIRPRLRRQEIIQFGRQDGTIHHIQRYLFGFRKKHVYSFQDVNAVMLNKHAKVRLNPRGGGGSLMHFTMFLHLPSAHLEVLRFLHAVPDNLNNHCRELAEFLNAPFKDHTGLPERIRELIDVDTLHIEKDIRELLEDENWETRANAAEALGILADASATEALINALHDRNGTVKRSAIADLGNIEDTLVTNCLLDLLYDDNQESREKAAEALGHPWHRHAVEPLMAVLEDKGAVFRREAAAILGNIGDARAVTSLINVLSESNRILSERAAEALEKVGVPAIEPLQNVLRDSHALISKEAQEILEHIYVSCDTVVFGQGECDFCEPATTLSNVDVSDLNISLSALKRIVIHTGTHNFRQVEQFLTYAVNVIGQKHLKKYVEVFIYEDPENLHPNLRNTLKNLCKQVFFEKCYAPILADAFLPDTVIDED